MHRLFEFKHRTVRDLAWTILSPPLAEFEADGVRGATLEWCQRCFVEFQPHLRALERDPKPLLDYLLRARSSRLGKYFELLIAYWLEASPRFEVLAQNLQIQDSKATYGELDFVVLDRERDCISHWEVAIKFYLQTGPAHELATWVGPNRRDNLGRKLKHLVLHQAPRSKHPAAQKALASRGLAVHEDFLFVKGRLFYGDRAPACGPSDDAPGQGACLGLGLHPAHLRSWWRTPGEFALLGARQELRWQRLIKPNWLADQSQLTWEQDALPLAALLELSSSNPLYVVGLLDQLELQRGFLVPEGWLLPSLEDGPGQQGGA